MKSILYFEQGLRVKIIELDSKSQFKILYIATNVLFLTTPISNIIFFAKLSSHKYSHFTVKMNL